MPVGKNTIRWGIIGCGDVTEIKSGPGFQKAGGSSLVAVMRRRGDLAADYARRHGVPRWYDNAAELISDPEVDAVYIATPPETHLHYALQVCVAGKPGYVEKPMARNHAECRTMVDAFARAKLPLFVAYYRRGLRRFLKAKELIDTGRLGKIACVTYRQSNFAPKIAVWRLDAAQSGGGFFLDVGSHTLDILDFLVGPLEDISGNARNVSSTFLVEDSVVMKFKAAGDALGAATWNFAAPVQEDLIEITGTNGRISLSTFGNDPVKLITKEGSEQFDRPNPPHIQQPLIQTIVDELLGRGKCPSTGESAARTSKAMDTALDRYYGGRADDFWNRPETWPGIAGRQTGGA